MTGADPVAHFLATCVTDGGPIGALSVLPGNAAALRPSAFRPGA